MPNAPSAPRSSPASQANTEVPIRKRTERFKPVAACTPAAVRTQIRQQGDKLEYRMTSLVRIVKPRLKAGQDSQENKPSSTPDVKYHPAIGSKRLATRSDDVGPISSR